MSIKIRSVGRGPKRMQIFTGPSFPVAPPETEIEGEPIGWTIGAMKKAYALFTMSLGQAVQHMFSYRIGGKDNTLSFQQWLLEQVKKSNSGLTKGTISFLGIKEPDHDISWQFLDKAEGGTLSISPAYDERLEMASQYQEGLSSAIQQARRRINQAIGRVAVQKNGDLGEFTNFETAWNFSQSMKQRYPTTLSYELFMWLPETNSVITYLGRKTSEGLVIKDDNGNIKEVSLLYEYIKSYNDFKFAVVIELAKLFRKRLLEKQGAEAVNKGAESTETLTDDDFRNSLNIVLRGLGDNLHASEWKRNLTEEFNDNLFQNGPIDVNVLYRIIGLYLVCRTANHFNVGITWGGISNKLMQTTFASAGVSHSVLKMINSSILHFSTSLLENSRLIFEDFEQLRANANRGQFRGLVRPEVIIKTGPYLLSIQNFVLDFVRTLKGSSENFWDCVSDSQLHESGCIHKIFDMALRNEIPSPKTLRGQDVLIAYAILKHYIFRNSKLKNRTAREKIEMSLYLWVQVMLSNLGDEVVSSDRQTQFTQDYVLSEEFYKTDGTLNINSLIAKRPNAIFLAFNFAVGSLIYAKMKDGYMLASFHSRPDALEIVGVDIDSVTKGGVVSLLGGTFLAPVLQRLLEKDRENNQPPLFIVLQENKVTLDIDKVQKVQNNRMGLLLLLYYIYSRKINQSFTEWIKDSEFWKLVENRQLRFGSIFLEFVGGIPALFELYTSSPREKDQGQENTDARDRLITWLEHYPPRLVLTWYSYSALQELATNLQRELQDLVEIFMAQEDEDEQDN